MSLKKKKEKKEEFSLEKVATAIHAEHLINSLKNKYNDPLILYRRKFANYKIKHHKTISDNDIFSLTNFLVSQYLKTKNDGDKINIDIKNDVLPIITPINLIDNKSKKFMVTSGMFKNKAYYKDNFQKLKLGNAMNYKNNEDSVYQYLYPKIENIQTINDKYNLDLNLSHLNEEKQNKNNKPKSISKKKDMMNYLLKKYIFQTYENNKNNDDKAINNFTLNINENVITPIINKRFKQKEFDNGIINNHVKKDDFSDNGKTFITKMNNKSKNIDESKEISIKTNLNLIKKPRKRIFNFLSNKNKDIIKYDQKIVVDCLYSKVNANIDEKKIIYNPLENTKTNHSITKDPSYKKIKKFEKIIDNIIKIPNNLTITADK